MHIVWPNVGKWHNTPPIEARSVFIIEMSLGPTIICTLVKISGLGLLLLMAASVRQNFCSSGGREGYLMTFGFVLDGYAENGGGDKWAGGGGA